MKDLKLGIGPAFVELKSVGSLLDIDTGTIYPQFGVEEGGGPDWSCPIELSEGEVAADWWEALSKEDYELVKKWY